MSIEDKCLNIVNTDFDENLTFEQLVNEYETDVQNPPGNDSETYANTFSEY